MSAEVRTKAHPCVVRGMIESITNDPDAPEWAAKKCDCGAYLEEDAITHPYDDERFCEGCHGAIQACRSRVE